MIVPFVMRSVLSHILEMPKSASFTVPARLRMMLQTETSRCTMVSRCSRCSTSSTWHATSSCTREQVGECTM